MRFTLGFAVTAATLFAGSSAHADSDGRPTVIVGIQPADGQVDVPIDVIPRVFTKLSDDGGDDFYSPDLTLLRGEEEVDSSQRQLLGVYADTTELSHSGLLEPNTSYTLVIEGEENWNGPVTRSVTFTTGGEKATPIAAPPTLEILSARFEPSELLRLRDTVAHNVEFRATPVTPDPGKLSVIRIVDGDLVYATFILGDEPLEATVYAHQAPGEEICFSAIQVNAAGEEQLSERVCATSEMAENGCAATGSTRSVPQSLAGLALAIALMVRRRR